jgi:dihydroorotate dehydrogenase (fumarate)
MPPDTVAHYLGMRLNSPIVVGSSPMTLNPETVRELSIAGAGAIVLPSLFEEQIVHRLIERGKNASAEEAFVESISYEQREDTYNGGPQSYLDSIVSLKATTGLPVIANLNGCTGGNWLNVAAEIEEAGADAIEVMLEPEVSDASTSADGIEQVLLDCVCTLCDQVSIPVAVKLSTFHTSLANLAWRLAEAGAAGLVCFSHDPMWEVHTERIEASLNWLLTPASNINPTIAGLVRARSGGPSISLAASGGICTPEDLVRVTIAGADVVMVTSEIYRSGPDVISHMLDGLCNYLTRHDLGSYEQLIRCRPLPKPFLRSAYLKSVTQSPPYADPTPHRLPPHSGDRWGHLQ